MARVLYVTGTGPGTGKAVVALGLMDLLAARAERVGFFRPVAAAAEGADPALDLVAARYPIGLGREALYGVTGDVARALVSEGRNAELLARILERYKAIEPHFEVVLCLGPDFSGATAALELDFSVEVARHLSALLVPVMNGRGRTPAELVDGARLVLETLEERRGDVLAAIVNGVDPAALAEAERRLRDVPPGGVPVYLVPEHPVLAMPTVGEVATALGARWLSRGTDGGSREVAHYKVAAMELPHFLDHLEDASLVITPGDRADIILGSLLADSSTTYPRVAALLLTGGLEPAPQVERLFGGLVRSPVPVLSVQTDTFTTAMAVASVEGHLTADNPRKIAAALGLVESRIDATELTARLAMPRPGRVTPLMFEFELIQRARRKRMRIVLPEGTEERVLRAAEILRLRDVADLILLGDELAVRRQVERLGLRLGDVRVVDPVKSEQRERYAETYFALRRHKGIARGMAYDALTDVSYFGTLMVYHGDADGMVSGAVHTTQHTIRPAFEVIRTAPGRSLISSVFFMCLADRVLVYGDCAVNVSPDAGQLAEIAISSAETAARFGVEPRVAMLSYSTGDSGQGEDVDRVREATRLARERRPDLKVEGPIQYDAAVDTAVARTKLPASEVAGQATVFVFPDLNTGNNTYKAVQRSSGAVAIGPVLQGLAKPVNDLSRGCTVTDIVNTVAITAIQAQSDGP
jgi:phosphate acetyltransferase